MSLRLRMLLDESSTRLRIIFLAVALCSPSINRASSYLVSYSGRACFCLLRADANKKSSDS